MTILNLKKPGLFNIIKKPIEVKLYDDVDEVPQCNYNDINNYALQDYEVGNRMIDVDKHFNQLLTLMVNNKHAEALQKAKNMYQTFYNMVEKIDFNSLQFGCFIHSIDGVEMTDYSMANIQATVSYLSLNGLTKGMIDKQITSLKKNSIRS